jgi:hypothetical protein
LAVLENGAAIETANLRLVVQTFSSKHHELDLPVFKGSGRENVASHLFNRWPICAA